MNDAELILVAGSLLAAGIGAALLAARLRLPGLVLFLALGMAIGSDGIGWIEFDDYELARTIGVIALALILFEGGLTSGYLEIRPVLRPALSLARAGDDRDGRPHRAGRQLAARLLGAGGAAARLDPRRHRRSGDLRSACAARP